MTSPSSGTTPTTVGFGGASVALQVRLPRTVAVDRIKSTDGDITITGVAGTPLVRSLDGNVVARGVAGDVVERTEDGRVVVDGTLTADIGSLQLRLDDALAVVEYSRRAASRTPG